MDKQQIRAILLHEFKKGLKAKETTCNINEAFGQEIVNKCSSKTLVQNIS
jgi:hypothetical protein